MKGLGYFKSMVSITLKPKNNLCASTPRKDQGGTWGTGGWCKWPGIPDNRVRGFVRRDLKLEVFERARCQLAMFFRTYVGLSQN